jgi:cytochrome c oxidase subunit IV
MNAPAAKRIYFAVFAALLALLGLTLLVAKLELGAWTPVLAMTIAGAKMLLILLYFMHVRYSRRLTWIFAGAGFFWLGVLLILTLSDYLTRPGV